MDTHSKGGSVTVEPAAEWSHSDLPAEAPRWGWRTWPGPVGLGHWRSVTGPTLFAVIAIALLVYNHLERQVNDVVFWLGLALVGSVFARMLETSRRQSETIERDRRSALSDRVTGLQNRLKLRADLAAALAEPGDRRVLVLLELDGLQAYNDRYGDAVRDGLLHRFAEGLVDAVEPRQGTAYRIDASRFSMLVPAAELQVDEIVTMATASLGEHNGDLLIDSAYSEVTLPDDSADPDLAIQMASQLLAARKKRQRNSAARQAHAVLMAVLGARRPELRDHLRVVAYRSIALGRRLGMQREQLSDVVLAAELQDTGMLTVPEAILEKQTPLSDHELDLIRAHPVAGERIIGAAPALASVASLVRASCEHFDGRGYPDGLAGEAIPLGARIIAVCVAFAAMTSLRPYRPAQSVEQALEELRRCSGIQFDPRVVEALADDLAEEASGLPAPTASPAGT